MPSLHFSLTPPDFILPFGWSWLFSGWLNSWPFLAHFSWPFSAQFILPLTACEKMIVGGSQLPAGLQETMVFAELKQPACRKQDAAITLKMDDVELEIYNGADFDVITHTLQALKSIC